MSRYVTDELLEKLTFALPVLWFTWPGDSRNQRFAEFATDCAAAVDEPPSGVTPGSTSVTVIDPPEALMTFSRAPFVPIAEAGTVSVVDGTAAGVTVVAVEVTEVADSAMRALPS